MTPTQRYIAAGAAASLPILGILLYRKVGNLLDQTAVMESALQAEAQRQVEAVAGETVEAYLGDTYGLTKARIERIGRIAAMLPDGIF